MSIVRFELKFQNMGVISDIKSKPFEGLQANAKTPQFRQILKARRFMFTFFTVIVVGFVITLVFAVAY